MSIYGGGTAGTITRKFIHDIGKATIAQTDKCKYEDDQMQKRGKILMLDGEKVSPECWELTEDEIRAVRRGDKQIGLT